MQRLMEQLRLVCLVDTPFSRTIRFLVENIMKGEKDCFILISDKHSDLWEEEILVAGLYSKRVEEVDVLDPSRVSFVSTQENDLNSNWVCYQVSYSNTTLPLI